MPQLNRDILQEIFYEIIKQDGSFENIDKFMMAGKEPFQLVLDEYKKAKDVVISNNKIVAKLIIGTEISASMALFKPISIAIASTLTSLNIRGFSPKLIPMLKSIDHEVKEVYICCFILSNVLEACNNITNVLDKVTIELWGFNFARQMRSFTFPCRKLTILGADFTDSFKEVIDNPLLRKNIRDLTIEGEYSKRLKEDLKAFAAFLISSFSNLETLHINFLCRILLSKVGDCWDWKDNSLAENFQCLPRGIRGCICFQIKTCGLNEEIDQTKYPGVQKNGNEYYKIFPITDTLSLKLVSAI